MTRTFLTYVLILLSGTSASAQYFSIGVQSGFGIGIPDATHGNYSTLRYSAAWGYVVEKYNATNKSLGQGVPVEIEFGYAGKSGISFGLTGGYLYGLKQSVNYGIEYYADKDERKATYQGHCFYAAAYLGMYKRLKNWGFSLRAYPLFTFPKYLRTTEIQLPDNPNGTAGDNYMFVREYKGPMTVGFKGSFDIEYLLGNGTKAVFFGFSYTHLSFSPSKSEVTTYEKNRHDDISSLTTNERYAEYSNSQEVTYDLNPDGSVNWTQHADQPYKDYKFDVPFDNFAFNLGFRFYFHRYGNHPKDEKPPL
ncbi:MAG: hypothetical protein GC178_10325 [Flavobacteriales bacterium]|nr:hypothetical protein [Flavobacteriales bacterium]